MGAAVFVLLASLMQDVPELPVEEPASVRFRAEAWFATMRGDFTINSDPILFPPFILQPTDGTSVSLRNDLGLESGATIPVLGIDLNLGKPDWEIEFDTRLSATFFRHSSRGRATLARSEVVDGTVFAAGSTVDSEMQFDYFALDFVATSAPLGDGTLRWNWLIGARGAGPRLKMESATASESPDLFGGFIAFGVGGAWQPAEWIECTASLTLSLGMGRMVEASLGISGMFGPVRATAGFRLLSLDAGSSDDQEEGDVRLSGPMLGGELRF